MTEVSRQMEVSMGSIFGGVKYFALILFALLIFLLTKIILEKNANSISMTKILGYDNKEIASLYIVSTVWVVIISAIISLVFNRVMFGYLLVALMRSYSGWFRLKIEFGMYLLMFGLMVGTYLVIAITQFFKIKKIPMEEALKNVE